MCRFPNGESGADVYDRMTIFEDHLVRDINAGKPNLKAIGPCRSTAMGCLWQGYVPLLMIVCIVWTWCVARLRALSLPLSLASCGL